MARLKTPGDPALAIWVKANKVVERPITEIGATGVSFDPAKLQFYTDRPSAIAILGTVGLIDQPGEYAFLPGRMAAVVMLPKGAHSVSIAAGRGGFDLGKASHVQIRALTFAHMADDGGRLSSGVAIFEAASGSEGIRIEDNVFRDMVMLAGQGPIILRHVSDVVIRGNTISSIMLGSGMRITGPASHVKITENRIDAIGRTGIMLMGIEDGEVSGNLIRNARGVHGNGISAYLANHRLSFIANTVVDAERPATFHGNGADDPIPNDIVFRNNLFQATPSGFAALISWGDFTRNVTIRNNVLVGGESGVRLSPKDINLEARDNVLSGFVVTGELPSTWRIADNRYVALSRQQHRGVDAVDDKLAAEVAKMLQTGQPGTAICALVTSGGTGADDKRIGATMRCP